MLAKNGQFYRISRVHPVKILAQSRKNAILLTMRWRLKNLLASNTKVISRAYQIKPCTLAHSFFQCFRLERMTKLLSRNAQMELQERHKYKMISHPRLNNLKIHAKVFLQKWKLASISHLRSKQQQMLNISCNLSLANEAISHTRLCKVRAALRIKTR